MDSDGYLSQLADIFNGITVNTPSISAIIAIALAGVLLLASGFASASEIAFFSLSPSDRNDIDEQNHPSDEKISAPVGGFRTSLGNDIDYEQFCECDHYHALQFLLYECVCFPFSVGRVPDTDRHPDLPPVVVR